LSVALEKNATACPTSLLHPNKLRRIRWVEHVDRIEEKYIQICYENLKELYLLEDTGFDNITLKWFLKKWDG
jgi:hypothetical protein